MPGNGRGLHPRQGFHHLGAGFFRYARPHGTAGEGRGQEILHRQGHLLVKVQVLGDIARAQVGNIPSLAVQVVNAAPVGELAQQRADQRGFARAVLSDQRGDLSAVDVHGHILEQGLSTPHHGHVLQVNMA